MKKCLFLIAALLAAGNVRAEPSIPADNTPLEQAADALLIGIPALAFGLTFLLQDDAGVGKSVLGFDFVHMTGSPRHDLTLAILRTETISYGLKYAVDSERPNGKEGSFPSSHTSTTFAGAEFIRKQYGWRWGAPAYLAAGYVGWSRVETGDHWWQDVLAGAVIGMLSNHDLRNLKTPLGGLSVRPAFINSWSGDQYQDDRRETLFHGTPGVNFELRFGGPARREQQQ